MPCDKPIYCHELIYQIEKGRSHVKKEDFGISYENSLSKLNTDTYMKSSFISRNFKTNKSVTVDKVKVAKIKSTIITNQNK